ncbi:MAG: hypothetical protein JXB03_05375 [Spirochaetales bacterium]|nr:hypothetical protein [Spirochaetales bacterium]
MMRAPSSIMLVCIAVCFVCGTVACSLGAGSDDGSDVENGNEDIVHKYGPEFLSEKTLYVEGSGTVFVALGDQRQEIDGFGGSNAWQGLPTDTSIRSQIVSLLFDRESGIGLSILRNRMPFRENPGDYRDGFLQAETDEDGNHISYIYTESDGVKHFTFNWNSWEMNNTRTLIQAITALNNGPEDLVVMSTPWTPPNLWKTGFPDPQYPAYNGTLVPEYYDDYADLLADFYSAFETNMGVSLRVLSVQNEPNWAPSYESCEWTAEEIRSFVAILGDRFRIKGVLGKVAVMGPEGINLEESLITPTLTDAATADYLDIVGVHQYEHPHESSFLGAEVLPVSDAAGKRIWVSEVSQGTANDPGIDDGIYWGKMVHYDMTITEINAFIYWWLWHTSDTKGSLINYVDSTLILNKRMYVLGQYSRFIRPGWFRVGTTASPQDNVYTSAYKSPDAAEMAIVLINASSEPRTTGVNVAGITKFTSIGAWRTSAAEDLAQVDAGGASDALSGSEFTVSLPAKSVTTLYGLIE